MGVKGKRIPFKIANQLVVDLQEFFSRWGDVTIVGSIRRKEETIGDIDFIIVPFDSRVTVKYFVNQLPKDEIVRYVRGENKMSIFVYRYNGYEIPINIWLTDQEHEGAMIFAYTGPTGYVIGYYKLAASKGLMMNRHGVHDKNGNVLASATEVGIYQALGKPWKDPTIRGKK